MRSFLFFLIISVLLGIFKSSKLSRNNAIVLTSQTTKGTTVFLRGLYIYLVVRSFSFDFKSGCLQLTNHRLLLGENSILSFGQESANIFKILNTRSFLIFILFSNIYSALCMRNNEYTQMSLVITIRNTSISTLTYFFAFSLSQFRTTFYTKASPHNYYL